MLLCTVDQWEIALERDTCTPDLPQAGKQTFNKSVNLSFECCGVVLKVLVTTTDAVGGDGGCRVGEVRARTTSSMPGHKGYKLQ